ncbi:phospho-N-acetylmuramoyl-pentapeptide-transferase [Roseofilum casamattae]|uniref:phospho-N-acetylmuramoyl-pentapeptide- transferase n=1 Tax=Roseofilum casamattae TaxID=3082944 RepID=UPI003D2F5A41
MDAKLTTGWSWSQWGTRLFAILAIALGSTAFILDWQSNRLMDVVQSLSVPFWVAMAITTAVGARAVPTLKAIKAGQIIREDGPQDHLKKAGTPTMGGIFFIPVAVLVAVVLSGFDGNVIAASLLTLGYGAIGWIDDWQILRRRSNKGISPRMKLILQTLLAVVFAGWMAWSIPENLTEIALAGGIILPLGFFFWPLAVFVLVSESNAVNLTDGLDGLAGGTCAIAFLALGAVLAATAPGLAILCACISGSCLGFLVFNRNPAQVFMGDTGSMALGGAIGAIALMSGNVWSLAILSGLFFVETLSVMLQVSYYKATKGPDGIGKRIFKMAPLHHHLELSGWSETQVVGVFYGVVGILAIVCSISA